MGQAIDHLIKELEKPIKIPPGLEDIMDEYVLLLKGNIQRLHDCVLNKDIEEIRKVVHKVRGTAATYGFNVVDASMVLTKDLTLQNDFDELEKLTTQLLSFIDNVKME